MIEQRTGPRWVWLLVILATALGILGGWWLFATLSAP
jgi:hypothetical protein